MVEYIGVHKFPIIESVTEYFLYEYPALRNQLSSVFVGKLDSGDVATAFAGKRYGEGYIVYDPRLFDSYSYYEQRHIVLHECFHQAEFAMCEKGVKVILDFAPNESPLTHVSSHCISDVETFAEIGAFWLEDRRLSSDLISYNGRLIHSALISL